MFAQANSLAVAVIDDELALTVHSNITFVKPVRAGNRVITKAIVIGRDEQTHRTKVEVTSTVNGETVLLVSLICTTRKVKVSNNEIGA